MSLAQSPAVAKYEQVFVSFLNDLPAQLADIPKRNRIKKENKQASRQAGRQEGSKEQSKEARKQGRKAGRQGGKEAGKHGSKGAKQATHALTFLESM